MSATELRIAQLQVIEQVEAAVEVGTAHRLRDNEPHRAPNGLTDGQVE